MGPSPHSAGVAGPPISPGGLADCEAAHLHGWCLQSCSPVQVLGRSGLDFAAHEDRCLPGRHPSRLENRTKPARIALQNNKSEPWAPGIIGNKGSCLLHCLSSDSSTWIVSKRAGFTAVSCGLSRMVEALGFKMDTGVSSCPSKYYSSTVEATSSQLAWQIASMKDQAYELPQSVVLKSLYCKHIHFVSCIDGQSLTNLQQ